MSEYTIAEYLDYLDELKKDFEVRQGKYDDGRRTLTISFNTVHDGKNWHMTGSIRRKLTQFDYYIEKIGIDAKRPTYLEIEFEFKPPAKPMPQAKPKEDPKYIPPAQYDKSKFKILKGWIDYNDQERYGIKEGQGGAHVHFVKEKGKWRSKGYVKLKLIPEEFITKIKEIQTEIPDDKDDDDDIDPNDDKDDNEDADNE